MHDTFSEWHDKKSNIESSVYRTYFQEREVWWCSIGKNIGFEQNGKGKNFARPVVIIRKFSNEVFWGIPLTTKIRMGKYYISVDLNDGIQRIATLSQLRLIDGKRLLDKIKTINKTDHGKIISQITNLLQNTKI